MAGDEDLLETMRQISMADTIYMNFDRSDQIKRQLEMLNSTGMKEDSVVTLIRRAPNRSFRLVPICKANMISIEDILQSGPDFVHQGKFLLCRSIMPAAESDTLTIVVDDPDGHRCSRVSLANFPATIRAGTILAIMHPWYDIISLGIRVENPVHVRVVDGDEDIVQGIQWGTSLPEESGVSDQKPIDDPSRRGNVYFVDKNYQKAVEAYSKAIQIDQENPTLYSNRAAAYLKMENPLLALQDTEIGLKMEPSNVKLLFRKAKAMIQLRRYEEAAIFMEEASEKDKEAMKEKAFANLMTASKRMVDESKNGNYDIVAMMEETKGSKLLENHAEYVAWDKFRVEEMTGKGRGLVAKEGIECGTLLMVCKAFVYAEVSECSSTAIDWSTKTAESPTFGPLVKKACAKMMNNPDLGNDFYKLYAGKKFGWLETADHSNPVDIDRISGIISLNTFSAEDSLFLKESPESSLENGGLWMVPSFFNHSCVNCNCFRFVIGDFMFVRATKTIGRGEELVMEYVSPWKPYEERRQFLSSSFGFECSCELCQVDRSESEEIRQRLRQIHEMVDGIRTGVKEKGNFQPKDVSSLKRMLEESLVCRPQKHLNPVALRVQKTLVVALTLTSPIDSQRFLEDVFAICESSGDLHAALVSAIGASRFKGAKMVEWIKRAKKLAKLLYGDERVVDLIGKM